MFEMFEGFEKFEGLTFDCAQGKAPDQTLPFG